MNTTKEKWDYKKATPFKQGLVILVLILIFNIISTAGTVGEKPLFQTNIFWINTIAFLLVYSIFNSVLSLF